MQDTNKLIPVGRSTWTYQPGNTTVEIAITRCIEVSNNRENCHLTLVEASNNRGNCHLNLRRGEWQYAFTTNNNVANFWIMHGIQNKVQFTLLFCNVFYVSLKFDMS